MLTSSSDDTVVIPAQRARSRRFLRFSLFSFLLIVSLICVSVSHFRVTSESRKLKQENDRLMKEMGYLVIHDPNKIYIRRIESLDDLTWRFRVYLPPKQRYMLNTKASRRSWGGNSIAQHEEQFTLTVALRRELNGKWQIKTTMPRSGGAGGADSEIVDELMKLEYPTILREDQKELDADKPYDLLRLVNEDFHVWIEPAATGQMPPQRGWKRATN